MLRISGPLVLLVFLGCHSYGQGLDTAIKHKPVLVWLDGGLVLGRNPGTVAGVHIQMRRVAITWRNISLNNVFPQGALPAVYPYYDSKNTFLSNNLLIGYRRYGRPWNWRISGGGGYAYGANLSAASGPSIHLETEAGVGFPLLGLGFLLYGNVGPVTVAYGAALTLQIGYIRRSYEKN